MTLKPGDQKLKDPDAAKLGSFDWDAELGSGVNIITATVTVSGPDALLVADSVTVAVSNRVVNYRLTGGTLGRQYTVTCRITTDETPAEIDDRSIFVLIQNL